MMALQPCTDPACGRCEGTRPAHAWHPGWRPGPSSADGLLHYHGYTASVLKGDPMYELACDSWAHVTDERGVDFYAGEPWHLWQHQ